MPSKNKNITDFYIREYATKEKRGIEVFSTEIVNRQLVHNLIVDWDGANAIWSTSDASQRRAIVTALEKVLGYKVND